MELFQLKIFIAVINTDGFSKAASQLHLSQSAISQRIQSLEEELGVKVFERQGHRITLTNFGKILLPYAEKITTLLVECEDTIKREREIQDNILSLGLSQAMGLCLFPSVIEEIFLFIPSSVKVSIFTGQTSSLIKKLRDNRINAAIVSSKIAFTDLDSFSIFNDELVFVASPTHRFSKLKELNLKKISNETLITFHQNTNYWQRVEQAFKYFGVDIKELSIIENDNIATIKEFVKNNLGVSILPKFTVKEEILNNQLVTKPLIPKIPQFEIDVQFVYNRSIPPSKPLRMLISKIKEFSNYSATRLD